MTIMSEPATRTVHYRKNECTDCGRTWETPEGVIPSRCNQYWGCVEPCPDCGEREAGSKRRCDC